MKHTISTLLIFVGLMNLYPVIGVLSAQALSNLYGVTIFDNDLLILMKHRAVMLGIIGLFMVVSAFRQKLQIPAIIVGLTSMMAFIGLALGTGEFGDSINKVMIADIIGSIVLIVVVFLRSISIK